MKSNSNFYSFFWLKIRKELKKAKKVTPACDSMVSSVNIESIIVMKKIT